MESMTGFAEHNKTIKTTTGLIELKAFARSWNNKFLDIRINLPPSWKVLEKEISNILHSHFSRGRIEVSLEVAKDASRELELNSLELEKLLNSSLKVAEKIIATKANSNDKYSKGKQIQSDELISNSFRWDPLNLFLLQEKLVSQRNILESGVREKLLVEISKLISGLQKNRYQEGKLIGKILLSSITKMDKEIKKILRFHTKEKQLKVKVLQASLLSNAEELKKANLSKLDSEEIQSRALAEASSSLEKNDLQEELDRLDIFCKRMKDELREALLTKTQKKNSIVSIGKSLDFISQEMIRETNTIGSKTKNIEIRKSVLEIKNTIEQIREQSRNIQ